MNVNVMQLTAKPLEVISLAAGCCYGKDDVSQKRVRSCYISGHMSVFEHASVTFKISGISRSCSHQLVRHRLASYSQQSQRYCRIDTDGDDWYVTPPDILEDPEKREWYDVMMRSYAKNYQVALQSGVKPEDARYLLPEACKTEICVTMNARELFHFLDVRNSERAQWEIRKMAIMMEMALMKFDGWKQLMEMRRSLFSIEIRKSL